MSDKDFIIGFDKVARAKETSAEEQVENILKGSGVGLASVLVGNGITGAVVTPVLASGANPEEGVSFAKKILSEDLPDYKVDFEESYRPLSDATGPNPKKLKENFYQKVKDWVIRHGPTTDAATAAHEVGHIKNYRTLQKAGIPVGPAMIAGRVVAPLAGLGAASFGLRKLDSESVSDAWKPVALGFTPTLIDEGLASARAFADISKRMGLAKALRKSPKLLAAFGTYASLPGSAYLASKLYSKKMKKEEDHLAQVKKSIARKKALRKAS